MNQSIVSSPAAVPSNVVAAIVRDNDPMADIELINPPGLAPPVGFAHVAAAGDLVVLGGQTGSDATGRIVAPGDLVAQFARAIHNVATALEAAGSRPDRVLKLTYFVTDAAAYRAALKPIGAAYREVFGLHYPATSLFEVSGLFDPEALVEIECTALR
jgi:enamine deaminase RidA (YjgF/YER057c/UK114 family)